MPTGGSSIPTNGGVSLPTRWWAALPIPVRSVEFRPCHQFRSSSMPIRPPPLSIHPLRSNPWGGGKEMLICSALSGHAQPSRGKAQPLEPSPTKAPFQTSLGEIFQRLFRLVFGAISNTSVASSTLGALMFERILFMGVFVASRPHDFQTNGDNCLEILC